MSIELASAYGLAMTIFNRFLDCARNDTSASSVQALRLVRLSSTPLTTGCSPQVTSFAPFDDAQDFAGQAENIIHRNNNSSTL
jgi:hypothetical protein